MMKTDKDRYYVLRNYPPTQLLVAVQVDYNPVSKIIANRYFYQHSEFYSLIQFRSV